MFIESFMFWNLIMVYINLRVFRKHEFRMGVGGGDGSEPPYYICYNDLVKITKFFIHFECSMFVFPFLCFHFLSMTYIFYWFKVLPLILLFGLKHLYHNDVKTTQKANHKYYTWHFRSVIIQSIAFTYSIKHKNKNVDIDL